METKIIIDNWVDITWYNLPNENSVNNFFLIKPYLITSNSPKKNMPIGMNQKNFVIVSDLISPNDVLLNKNNIKPIERLKIKSIYKQSLYTFIAISSFLGRTIAISYLSDATTPKIVIIEINNWYSPNWDTVNNEVINGRVININKLEKTELEDSLNTFFINSSPKK